MHQRHIPHPELESLTDQVWEEIFGVSPRTLLEAGGGLASVDKAVTIADAAIDAWSVRYPKADDA